jgi:hypothetical protein
VEFAAGQWSRLVAELISVGIGLLGIRVLWAKQHRLHGATRVFRWAIVAIGIALFAGWQYGYIKATFGFYGLCIAGFFVLFPDISYHLAIAYQKVRARPGAPEIHNRPR